MSYPVMDPPVDPHHGCNSDSNGEDRCFFSESNLSAGNDASGQPVATLSKTACWE